MQTSWTLWEDTLDSKQHVAGIAAYCQLPGNVSFADGESCNFIPLCQCMPAIPENSRRT